MDAHEPDGNGDNSENANNPQWKVWKRQTSVQLIISNMSFTEESNDCGCGLLLNQYTTINSMLWQILIAL